MRRAGMSILEILVGMVILAVAGMAVIGAMRQSAREVDTTSDHTLSLFLSQKEMEEALQAVHENTYIDTTPGSWGGPRASIKDRGHPHFVALADTEAPFGRLEGTDIAIDQRDEALYRMFRDFSLSVEATEVGIAELGGTDKHLFDLSITTDCPGIKNGSSRFFSLPLLVPKPLIGPERPPPVVDDPGERDTAIKTGLYPAVSAADLNGVATQVGGSLSVMRDVGGILVVAGSARAEMSAAESQIVTLQQELLIGGFASPEREAEKRVEIARAYEKRAAIAWRSLLWSREPAGTHSTSLTKAAMGGDQGPSGYQVIGQLDEMTRWRDAVTSGCAAALFHLYEARKKLGGAPARPFWQFTLDRKILELAKLHTLLTGSPDMTFHAQFTDFLLAYYRARNRNVEAFLTTEKARIRTLDDIRTQYPIVAGRVSSTETAITALGQLRDKAIQEYSGP
jgi:type II secretory pathway pseudopilin PulG